MVQILNRKDMLHPWVYDRCREVERNTDGYLDLWSREHFKSSIITQAGTIQEILRNPEITIGIFSHTKAVARKFLEQIRTELQKNDRLKALFPEVLYQNPERESPSWSLDNGIVVRRQGNPKEKTVEANGLIDGMPTGAHYRLRIYDDVVTRESVGTPEQIQKTTEAWELSDNLGMEGGRVWMVGTRYHYSDTYHAIEQKAVVKLRIYPATDTGTPEGRPVLWSQEEWDRRRKTQGPAVVACQLLLNPNAGQLGMFDVADLREYEIRPHTLNVYIMCDPARSMKKDSDKTAMLVIGVDHASNKFLLDGFNHRMKLKERWERFAELYIKWKRAPGVQHIKMGYEAYGAQADLDYFQEQQALHDVRFSIVLLEWPREGPGSKSDRVQRLGPDLRSHKFYVPYSTDPKKLTSAQRRMEGEGAKHRIAQSIIRFDEDKQRYDLVKHLREQIEFFPNIGFKDVVDCASRLYDMEPMAPTLNEPKYAEPEFC
jgi:hypothetical protein